MSFDNMQALSIPWIVVLTAIGAYSIFNASSIYLTDEERLVYVSVFVAILAFVARDILFSRTNSRVFKKVSIGLAVLIVFLLPAFTNDYLELKYVAADFISLFIPVLLFGMLMSDNSLLTSKQGIALLALILVASALVAIVFGVLNGNRFEPPSAILICILTYAVANSSSNVYRLIALLLIAATAFLILASGQRSALIMLLIGILLAVFTMKSLEKRSLYLLILSIVGMIVAILFSERIYFLLGDSRFSSLLRFEFDVSLLTRFNEVNDALHYLKTNGNIFNWLIGFGHGATFESYSVLNLRNYLDSERVHHIHIGPALILFRYGLVGIFLYLFLWFSLLSTIVRMRRFKIPSAAQILTISCVLLLLDGLVRNVFVDPRTSLALAAFIYTRHRILLLTNHS